MLFKLEKWPKIFKILPKWSHWVHTGSVHRPFALFDPFLSIFLQKKVFWCLDRLAICSPSLVVVQFFSIDWMLNTFIIKLYKSPLKWSFSYLALLLFELGGRQNEKFWSSFSVFQSVILLPWRDATEQFSDGKIKSEYLKLWMRRSRAIVNKTKDFR